MDPITSAIVAALPALATEIASSSVKDAYAGVKSLIARKLGATSAVAKSVDDLEKNPKSQGRAQVLSESVAEAKAASDAEIMAAVGKMLEELAKVNKSAAQSVNIDATVNGGVAGVVGAQNVSIGSLNVGGSRPREKG